MFKFKFRELFTESLQEMKKTRTAAVMAMLMAAAVVLGNFTLAAGEYLKIGFSNIANQLVCLFFGPAAGMFFGAAADILKFLARPSGAYFPGFTLDAAAAGLLYGFCLYRRPLSFKRVLFAELIVALIVNAGLATFWLSLLYGKGFFVLLPMRLIKNLVQWPVSSFLLYNLARLLGTAGIFRMLQEGSGA